MTQRLLSSPAFQRSKRVGLYVSCERLHEVDTLPIVRAVLANPEQTCFLPRVNSTQPHDMRFLRIG
jgi:5-formyltetrahydrofolate cyclo-ligase